MAHTNVDAASLMDSVILARRDISSLSFTHSRSDLSVESQDRTGQAGKDQIKAFSLSKSGNHVISYQTKQ